MTNKRILELAYQGAMLVWTSRIKTDMIGKHREETAWKELKEITKLLHEEKVKEIK